MSVWSWRQQVTFELCADLAGTQSCSSRKPQGWVQLLKITLPRDHLEMEITQLM